MTYPVEGMLIIAAILILVVGIVVAAVIGFRNAAWREVELQEFHTVCASKGGTAVYNRRNWECLK